MTSQYFRKSQKMLDDLINIKMSGIQEIRENYVGFADGFSRRRLIDQAVRNVTEREDMRNLTRIAWRQMYPLTTLAHTINIRAEFARLSAESLWTNGNPQDVDNP